MYFKSTSAIGGYRAFTSGASTDADSTGAKWRWSEAESWLGPCTHSQQYGSEYRWFHFKASTRSNSNGCQNSNYENRLSESNGFHNADGSGFFPMTGWSGDIKVYTKRA
jgi:hypothetical protein